MRGFAVATVLLLAAGCTTGPTPDAPAVGDWRTYEGWSQPGEVRPYLTQAIEVVARGETLAWGERAPTWTSRTLETQDLGNRSVRYEFTIVVRETDGAVVNMSMAFISEGAGRPSWSNTTYLAPCPAFPAITLRQAASQQCQSSVATSGPDGTKTREKNVTMEARWDGEEALDLPAGRFTAQRFVASEAGRSVGTMWLAETPCGVLKVKSEVSTYGTWLTGYGCAKHNGGSRPEPGGLGARKA